MDFDRAPPQKKQLMGSQTRFFLDRGPVPVRVKGASYYGSLLKNEEIMFPRFFQVWGWTHLISSWISWSFTNLTTWTAVKMLILCHWVLNLNTSKVPCEKLETFQGFFHYTFERHSWNLKVGRLPVTLRGFDSSNSFPKKPQSHNSGGGLF